MPRPRVAKPKAGPASSQPANLAALRRASDPTAYARRIVGQVREGKLDLDRAAELLEGLIAANRPAPSPETLTLAAIGRTVGEEDPDAIVAACGRLLADAKRLRDAQPEILAVRKQAIEAEEAAAEQDVADAIRVHRLGEGIRPALVAMRTGGHTLDAKDPMVASRLKLRAELRERFKLHYPTPPHATEYLLGAIATKPPERQPIPIMAGARHAPPVMQQVPPLGPAPVDLSGYPGGNDVERCMAFIRAQPGGDKLDHDTVWQRACEMNRARRLGGR